VPRATCHRTCIHSRSSSPDWSGTFARQAEIHDYLRHCASKYQLLPHIRFGVEVARAQYDEGRAIWRVNLTGGEVLHARMLVSATGLLGRPALARLDGADSFKGRAFHSARWDHGFDLTGKRVAVIGTGASAAQFVPAIADKVSRLLVFQRTPSYIIARPGRPYKRWEKALFRRVPFAMRAHRAWFYLTYESRALAFTRLKWMLELTAGRQFRRLLAAKVADPELRASLTPSYPAGCKRILLAGDYLAALCKPQVELVTAGIRRITRDGIETVDGVHHQVDAIIYGTGFAATDFLTPMHIVGRGGRDLNDAWREGAQAYLGMTVPDFPNFFMLYGPNTNLGHNSIVYMLESQVAHVMRCHNALRSVRAAAIETDLAHYRRFNQDIQRRLAGSVWASCKSWYVDANGRNSANWPGSTLTYRWLTRFSSLYAYRFTRPLPGRVGGVVVIQPPSLAENLLAAFQRGVLRACFRALVGPPFGVLAQRRIVRLLAPLMRGVRGVTQGSETVNNVRVEVLTPRREESEGVVLYLHGGAFCLGSPATHRSITTRLSVESGMPVWVPDYRLAPEHPYPAALDDAQCVYEALRRRGYAAERIVVAGDSAGATLALALALRLRDTGMQVPAGLLLISPVADPTLSGSTVTSKAAIDPMIRAAWVKQALGWYACPADVAAHRLLGTSLRGLPPMLLQVGEQEILLSDAARLAKHAAHCGVQCRFEVHESRWHVYHLQAFYLKSARAALRTLARFGQECVRGEGRESVAAEGVADATGAVQVGVRSTMLE